MLFRSGLRLLLPFSLLPNASMVQITVKPRSAKPTSKRFPLTLDLSAEPTVGELKAAIATQSKVRSFPFSSWCAADEREGAIA